MTGPNSEYDIFERITVKAYDFPKKRVKVNKYNINSLHGSHQG